MQAYLNLHHYQIIETTGETRIQTVIGGLHLINASPERLDKTARAFNEFDLHRLVACHCTGDESYFYLANNLNCQLIQGYGWFSLSF